ncbi:MAG: hypothetical protein GKR89_19455 [Candidatus Latescibacteria bacterium]|nr:hypothetical protein [Candidatus Latescibacterota bacterium]
MSVHFVFVTDSHHYPEAPQDYGAPKMLTRSHQIMSAAIPQINALQPQFVVHGGDLLCGGGSFDLPFSTYCRSIAETAAVFGQLEAPVHYIPGNHDCDAQEGSFAELARHFPIPQLLDIVPVAPRLRLALANVYLQSPLDHPQGHWTSQHDRALRQAADQAQEEKCALLLVIHPWVLPTYEPAPGGFVGNAAGLLETIVQCPAIAAVFTGHRHTNRIRVHRDFLVVDTACLVGYPLGFRQIWLGQDGYFKTRFQSLDLPALRQESFDRSTAQANQVWAGEVHDRDSEILIPRLQALWA